MRCVHLKIQHTKAYFELKEHRQILILSRTWRQQYNLNSNVKVEFEVAVCTSFSLIDADLVKRQPHRFFYPASQLVRSSSLVVHPRRLHLRSDVKQSALHFFSRVVTLFRGSQQEREREWMIWEERIERTDEKERQDERRAFTVGECD